MKQGSHDLNVRRTRDLQNYVEAEGVSPDLIDESTSGHCHGGGVQGDLPR